MPQFKPPQRRGYLIQKGREKHQNRGFSNGKKFAFMMFFFLIFLTFIVAVKSQEEWTRPLGQFFGGFANGGTTIDESGIRTAGNLVALGNYVNLTITNATDIYADNYYFTNGSSVQSVSADNLGNHIATTDLNMGGKNIKNVDIINGSGNNVRIGNGLDNRGLSSANDLFITGKLETDGITFFDNQVVFYGNSFKILSNGALLFSGSGDDGLIGANSAGHLILGDTYNNIVISQRGWGVARGNDRNYDHGTQTNPTLYIHSAIDPDTDNTQWVSFSHNQSDSIIKTGKGSIVLDDDVIIDGTSIINGDTFIDGDFNYTGQFGKDCINWGGKLQLCSEGI